MFTVALLAAWSARTFSPFHHWKDKRAATALLTMPLKKEARPVFWSGVLSWCRAKPFYCALNDFMS